MTKRPTLGISQDTEEVSIPRTPCPKLDDIRNNKQNSEEK